MQSKIAKSAMVNGLIVGLLLSLKFLLSAQKLSFYGFLGLVVSISVVFVLYKMAIDFRDKELDGIITYKHAFRHIFQIYFYGCIISSMVILLYTKYISPDYLDNYLGIILKFYHNVNFPMDEKSTKVLETFFTPAPFAITNIFSGVIGGAFWGLILAAFVKKDKSIFE